MNATRKPWQGAAGCLLAVLLATSATAAPVVVGSVNPATQQVTIFQDLLVVAFPDGTPIQHIYGRFDAVTQEFVMVRAGHTAAGGCHTDAFRLLRLLGNRLALAAERIPYVPWNGTGAIPTLKHCLGGTCHGTCQVLGDPETPLDLTDYICYCSNATGECEAVFNELRTLDEIVVQDR